MVNSAMKQFKGVAELFVNLDITVVFNESWNGTIQRHNSTAQFNGTIQRHDSTCVEVKAMYCQTRFHC